MSGANVYMNGRGIMARTNELNDAVWDALPFAFLGSIPGVIGGILAIIGWGEWWALPVGVGSLAVCWYLAAPWFRACSILKAHTRAIKAETAKHGRGWARG